MKKLIYLLILSLFVFTSCEQEEEILDLHVANVANKILDGANKGNKNFYFLPPLVSSPTVSGIFTPSLNPKVKIYALNGSDIVEPAIAVFDSSNGLTTDLIEEHYKVNWNTNDYNLDDQVTYRIQILVDVVVLGYADVDVVSSGNELRNVNTGEFIALKDGRTLPITFRIEEGAVINALLLEGLIAFYPFNGNANDESDYENNGTVNGATLTSDRYGNLNSAYNFDGLDDFIQIPSAPENILGSSDFTVITWFKTSTLNAGMIWNKRNTSSCSQAYGPTNGLRVGYTDGNKLKSWIRSTSYTEIYSDGSVVDGNWHQVCMKREGNIYSMYLDGQLVDSIPISGNTNFSTTLDLFIGKTTYCTGGNFNGDIDDFSIYDRALSSDEIITLFNN